MTSSKIAVLMIGAASLSLAACDKIAAIGAKQQAAATAGDKDASDQLDAYIGAHNRLVGSFGFYERAESYRKSDIAHASTDGQFLVDDGSIEHGIDDLKAARALSGAPADVNAAADAVIGSMTTVRTHLAALAPYYTSKAYMEDNLARGRKEDPQMLAEISAADKDLTRFSDLIDRNMLKREEKTLETLKANGDMLHYNSRLAMFRANALITRFTAAQDKDAALFAKADADVSVIQTAIAGAHDAAAKAGEKDEPELHYLSSMIGSYRSFKQRPNRADADQMLSSFNTAVQLANH